MKVNSFHSKAAGVSPTRRYLLNTLVVIAAIVIRRKRKAVVKRRYHPLLRDGKSCFGITKCYVRMIAALLRL